MDYKRIYDSLIDRARARGLVDGYTEAHHVVPRCMGGGDEPSNIVRLTAEEHFVAHELLVKMFPGNAKVVYGLLAMSMGNRGMRPTNKTFGWVRRLVAQAIAETKRGVKRDPEMMAKIWAGNRGRVAPDVERDRISAGLKGKPKSDAHRAKLSEAIKGRESPMKGRAHSEETKRKMREAATGRKMKPEDVSKMINSKTPEQRRAAALKAWETKRAKKAREGEG
ncbi:NUMOD3 domain-containing DNA-binding protein [Azospirillum sp. A26]|uniref:NUMOD3 domain-containing DNA-binding protein n=1 Tax=Azospirillum sp. A26 TaxID=3160607 RepID=UPI0036706AD0